MRKTIKNTLFSAVFLAGLLALLLLLSRVFIPKGNDRSDGMLDVRASGIDAEPAQTIDVLIVGDSESYHGLVPLKMWKDQGITSYVCGTPEQRLFASYRWIERVCENQSPRAILLETNAIFRQIPYSEAYTAPLHKLLPILDYHSRWKILRLRDFTDTPVYTHVERNKGYYYDDSVNGAEEDDAAAYMEPTSESEKVRALNQFYLDLIADFCRDRDIRLVLVSTPSTKNWNAKRHNAVEYLAKRMDAVYLDMNMKNDEIGINWLTDTYDGGDHLNHSGAVKTSAYLGSWLAKSGVLTDHRGDAAYASWDAALADAEAEGMDLETPKASK